MSNNLLKSTRCNHALEHATIALLNQRHPHAQVVGLSGPLGFTLYTNLTAEEIFPAVTDALRYLKQGHHALAIHPNCGTNLLTAATLTTAVTWLTLNPIHEKPEERVDRILRAILLNALMLLLARPLGSWMQAHLTVDPHVGHLELAAILTEYQGKIKRVRVHTRYNE